MSFTLGETGVVSFSAPPVEGTCDGDLYAIAIDVFPGDATATFDALNVGNQQDDNGSPC